VPNEEKRKGNGAKWLVFKKGVLVAHANGLGGERERGGGSVIFPLLGKTHIRFSEGSQGKKVRLSHYTKKHFLLKRAALSDNWGEGKGEKKG